jgi:hypothetical protein
MIVVSLPLTSSSWHRSTGLQHRRCGAKLRPASRSRGGKVIQGIPWNEERALCVLSQIRTPGRVCDLDGWWGLALLHATHQRLHIQIRYMYRLGQSEVRKHQC